MKLFLKIVFGLMGVLFLVVVALYFLFPRSSSTPIGTNNPSGGGNPFGNGSTNVGGNITGTSTATSTGATTPAGKIIIRGQNGSSILVNDFLASTTPHAAPVGNYYELTGKYTSTSTRYSIVYTDSDNGFSIALFANPLGAVRQEAENKLLSLLGVSKADACNLSYDIGVPYSVNQYYSGQNVKFSFCQGAVLLPEI